MRRATRRRVEGNDEAGFTLIELLITVVILPLVLGGHRGRSARRLRSPEPDPESHRRLQRRAGGLGDVQQGRAERRAGDDRGLRGGRRLWEPDVRAERRTDPADRTAVGRQQRGERRLSDRRLLRHRAAPRRAPPRAERVRVGTPGVHLRAVDDSDDDDDDLSRLPPPRHFSRRLYGPVSNTASNLSELPFNLAGQCSIGSRARLDAGPGRDRRQLLHHCTRQPVLLHAHGSPGREHLHRRSITGAGDPAQSGCSFANPGTGTYARQLCFADFTSFTDPSGQSGCQKMKLLIADSSDYLQFCVIATPQNTVRPQVIPTFYLPGTGRVLSTARRSWATTASTPASRNCPRSLRGHNPLGAPRRPLAPFTPAVVIAP